MKKSQEPFHSLSDPSQCRVAVTMVTCPSHPPHTMIDYESLTTYLPPADVNARLFRPFPHQHVQLFQRFLCVQTNKQTNRNEHTNIREEQMHTQHHHHHHRNYLQLAFGLQDLGFVEARDWVERVDGESPLKARQGSILLALTELCLRKRGKLTLSSLPSLPPSLPSSPPPSLVPSVCRRWSCSH